VALIASGAQDGCRAGDEELKLLTVVVRKTRVLARAYQQDGARGVAGALAQKVKSTWRRGEVWQLGRFVGLPSEIVRMDGCKFTIDRDLVPANVIDLLLSDRYEEPERAALKKFLDPELPVIELGACIGIVSCLSNRRLRNPENHVVVEANPALLPILEQNRDRNNCRFKIVHAAISYGAETISFNVDDNILASSVHGGDQRAVVVSTVTLEKLLNDHGFERVTLICDIEGAELQLVEHELATLSERVAAIIMELHDRIIGEEPTRRMLASLKSAGFGIVKKDSDVVILEKSL
jgi:FkbM family methyltransferase